MSKHENFCADFAGDYLLYHHNELPEERQQQWAHHLQHCAACRHKAGELSEALGFYAAVAFDDVDDITFETMVEKATANKSPKKWLYAGWAAAACCVVLLFFLLNNKPSVDLSWDYRDINQTMLEAYDQINLIEMSEEPFEVSPDFLLDVETLSQQVNFYKEYLNDLN